MTLPPFVVNPPVIGLATLVIRSSALVLLSSVWSTFFTPLPPLSTSTGGSVESAFTTTTEHYQEQEPVSRYIIITSEPTTTSLDQPAWRPRCVVLWLRLPWGKKHCCSNHRRGRHLFRHLFFRFHSCSACSGGVTHGAGPLGPASNTAAPRAVRPPRGVAATNVR